MHVMRNTLMRKMSGFIRKISALQMLACLAGVFVGVNGAQAANDLNGKDWRQITDTRGATWDGVASVCPQDGITPCTGSLSGWVWATQPQVLELYARYVPDIINTPGGVSGIWVGFAADNYFAFLRPTWSFAATYQFGSHQEGWIAGRNPVGQAWVGSVGNGGNNVSIDGSFGIGGDANSAASSSFRGVYLWRSTALGGITAADDAGIVSSITGGTAIANVLSNDWVNGQSASFQNASLSAVSSSSAFVQMDATTGRVYLNAGAPSGSYVLSYRICDLANPDRCAQANATVQVPRYAIAANDDAGAASPSTGGIIVANVLQNDTFGGAAANQTFVQISNFTASHPGITINSSTGAVSISTAVTLGTHTASYQLCERADPSNCDSANISLTIRYETINAVDDAARASNRTPGVLLANVLANDRLGSALASTQNVRIRQVSLSPATPFIVLNTATGAIQLTKKVDSITYVLAYEICEINAPSNCDTANVTLTLSGRGGS
jgi:hypothetical protein